MTVTIGKYTFTRADYIPDRDWLLVDNGPGSLVIMEYETSDGDRWFSPSVQVAPLAGIEIEAASVRASLAPLTVEMPDGTRAEVVGDLPGEVRHKG